MSVPCRTASSTRPIGWTCGGVPAKDLAVAVTSEYNGSIATSAGLAANYRNARW